MQSNVSEAAERAGVHTPPGIDSIPERFRRKSLDEWDASISRAANSAGAAAFEFVTATAGVRVGRSLVLSGPPGAGKTHLAAGICNAIWASDWTAYEAAEEESQRIGGYFAAHPTVPSMPRWANVPSLINRLRGGDDEVRGEARALGRYPGLVVLDDLGREKVTEWTGETIYVLVNDRYERQLSTIVTTNLSVKELADNGYGPAISRLAEDGRLIAMDTATDYRTRR